MFFFGSIFLFLRLVGSGWTRNGGYVEETMELALTGGGGGGEEKRHDRSVSVVSGQAVLTAESKEVTCLLGLDLILG